LLAFATKVNEEGVDLYELQRQQSKVPTLTNDYGQNRLNANPRGPFQNALRFERMNLIEGIEKYQSDVAKLLPPKLSITELKESIAFIPNARFTWFNLIIKKILSGKKIKQGDIDFVRTVWMEPRLKENLIAFLKNNSDNSTGYSYPPIFAKNGLRFDDVPGSSNLKISLRNPGDMFISKQDETTSNKIIADTNRKFMQGVENSMSMIRQKMDKLIQKSKLIEDTQNIYMISHPNNPIIRTLEFYRDKLDNGVIEVGELLKISDSIQKYVGARKSKYLMSLAEPFVNRTARIPTLLSPPSATFSIRSLVPLTTNTLGNVAFAFNPAFLSAATVPNTSFFINNNVALDGVAPAAFFLGVAIGQELPANFYTRFRLVSAGIKIYLYPSSNNDQGILTVSATFETITAIAVAGVNAALTQFSAFSQIENGYYKKTTTVASREVQEHVYIPIDESKWNYATVGTSVEGYGWLGYITGAAASTNVARVELIANYEALLDNQYTDYLPSDSPLQDLEPSILGSVLRSIKNNPEANTPIKIATALNEANLSLLPDQQIKLNSSRKDVSNLHEDKNIIENVAKQIATMANPIIQNHPDKEESKNWSDKLTGFLSEIGQGLYSVGSKIVTDTFFPIAQKGLENLGTSLISSIF